MLVPMETTSTGGLMEFEGASPEITSVEVSAEVPKLQRSPRLSPMPPKEGHKTKKDKYKAT